MRQVGLIIGKPGRKIFWFGMWGMGLDEAGEGVDRGEAGLAEQAELAGLVGRVGSGGFVSMGGASSKAERAFFTANLRATFCA